MNNEARSSSSGSKRPLLHGVDWAVQAGVTDEVMLVTRRQVHRRRQRRLALAGGIAAVTVGLAVWFSPVANSTSGLAEPHHSTVVSAPVRRVLPDGSVVELKDGAEILVAYSGAVRRIQLLRGEAHFQVMHDTARPFIVAVDSVEVRAVGTAFSVQRGADQVEVLVTTGRVAVDRVAENHGQGQPPATQTIAMIDAGNRTRVEVAASSAQPLVEPLSADEIAQRLAWRVPRLEFTRTPLADAVSMINEHSAIKLSLADPALGQVRISGLLRADNIEALFRLLETEHGIIAEHRSDGAVVLRSGH